MPSSKLRVNLCALTLSVRSIYSADVIAVGRMKKRAIDGERRESAGMAQRREEESRFFDSPLRRYGAGHVSELLLARGKKLDDEQVGRG